LNGEKKEIRLIVRKAAQTRWEPVRLDVWGSASGAPGGAGNIQERYSTAQAGPKRGGVSNKLSGNLPGRHYPWGGPILGGASKVSGGLWRCPCAAGRLTGKHSREKSRFTRDLQKQTVPQGPRFMGEVPGTQLCFVLEEKKSGKTPMFATWRKQG